MTQLELFKKMYGDLVFPNPENVHNIKVNSKDFFISYNGMRWEAVPEDIPESDMLEFVFRKRPNGVFAGSKEALASKADMHT